jgi:hypothetical protein
MSDVTRTIPRIVKVTPSDSDKLTKASDGIRANEDGIVRVRTRKSSGPVDLYLLAGLDYAYEIEQVFDTGTTNEGDVHVLYYE